MTWTTPRTWVNSALVTGVQLNSAIRDNFNMTAPALVTTAGDMVYATGANALARLAVGSAGQVLQGGSIPSWVTPSQLFNTESYGKMFFASGINATPQTLIASGLVRAVAYIAQVLPSGSLAQTTSVAQITATTNLYNSAGDILTLTISAGSMTVARTGGSKTYTLNMFYVYR